MSKRLTIHIPTELSRKEVASLVSHGIELKLIAKKIGINEETLKEHYLEELNTGKLEAIKSISNALFQAAMGGNVRAMELWLKCQANWDEKQTTRLVGEEDKPVVSVTFMETAKPSKKKGLGKDGDSGS